MLYTETQEIQLLLSARMQNIQTDAEQPQLALPHRLTILFEKRQGVSVSMGQHLTVITVLT